ncbi:flagellar basal body P-ring protein FlgI [bacterium]|nr:flagellar basal body P-ring protein FlgI [bacterium]
MRQTARLTTIIVLVLLQAFVAGAGQASRIKDLAGLAGSEREPLLGYGLVVGLNGTGDGQSAAFTTQSLVAMLERLDVTVDPSVVKLKNVAAVLLTAQADPGATPGARIDVTVSSLGDCSSLEGGMLIMSPLKGADGRSYAIAQGPVSIGGFNVAGGAGNSFRKNHSTVGRIPNGAKIEIEMPGGFYADGRMAWLLHSPDFATAQRVADAINLVFGGSTARAVSAQRVDVHVPVSFHEQPVDFIARMGELSATSDQVARVVINERTGTIIVGAGVVLREAAVAHGNMKVVIRTSYDVSQPNSFNESGRTVVTPSVVTDVQEKEASVIHVPQTGTVSDVVAVLNEVGASPRDIIAILQALKQAGALQAELIIM